MAAAARRRTSSRTPRRSEDVASLWKCPKCGARLLTRNLWHSCGLATLADWEARMGPRARTLYDAFVRMIGDCGPYHVAPAKTRIAFLGQVRFANITRLTEQHMTCTFSLPLPVRSPRISRIVEVVPGWCVHTLHVTDPGQLDAEVRGWFLESYRLMGMRERLQQTAARQVRTRR